MAKKISCKSTQIETNLIVPPETTSPQKNLHRFLVKRPQTKCKKSLLNFKLNSIDVSNPDVIIKKLKAASNNSFWRAIPALRFLDGKLREDRFFRATLNYSGLFANCHFVLYYLIERTSTVM